MLFRLAGNILCNSVAVKQAIVSYGINPAHVTAFPGFSSRHLKFTKVTLSEPIESFLQSHWPIFFCYVSFRPEYKLPVLHDAMCQFLELHPRAGFIWLGFPAKELPDATTYTTLWPMRERMSLLLLGNLPHDEFLTLLERSSAYVRTPACDGISASVLEALALGVPVLASQNGHRPPGVMTYEEGDAANLFAGLVTMAERLTRFIPPGLLGDAEDNIAKTADWLLTIAAGHPPKPERGLARAT
jgi:glycosyltransferase involved in cell wall biosynthesis